MESTTKTTLLLSNELVREIDDQTVLLSRKLREQQIMPTLAVVAVGETKTSPFIQVKKKRGRSLGLEVSVYELPVKATVEEVQSVIDFLNKDNDIHGIIVQLPLSKNWTEAEVEQVLQTIEPKKDVDALGRGQIIPTGFDLTEMESKATAMSRYLPTTAHAMLKLCQHFAVDLNQEIVVVGKGRLVGQPLVKMLQAVGLVVKAVDKESKDLNQTIYQAQVILAGTDSQTAFLNDIFVQAGASVIAAGAEIDFETLTNYAAHLTPAKGGVGPLTVSLLLKNVVRAASQNER